MVPFESLGNRFLFAFHSNYGRICSRSVHTQQTHECDGHRPATGQQQIPRLCIALRGKNS